MKILVGNKHIDSIAEVWPEPMSQNAKAEALGMKQSSVCKLEKKDFIRIKLATLERYAKACGYQLEIRFAKVS